MSCTIYLGVLDSGKIPLEQLSEWLELFDAMIEFSPDDAAHDFIALKHNLLKSLAEHGVIVDSQTHSSYYRFSITIANSWLGDLDEWISAHKEVLRHHFIRPLVHKQKHQALNRYEQASLTRFRKECANNSAMQRALDEAFRFEEFAL
ncbi:hypothetical protein H5200_12170 [Pseudoalteromonas sp. SG43-7]|uniref:hypothetical protein n=1 Tax=Pseudoalteromonas sp. SG43-7 TaxID=2760966 RepID=UPI0015FF8437|nr:hypothetical protein [Pseudoalteromonas sp. SG43-7]MBB1422676.1 hypothetical protein [Pseudoalteromonas sp. SG43-7]